MNEKFFALPEARRRAMLNAAYRVFAENEYKKAPMSEIADEAGISKALLFHYFHNKAELYLYLWDNAAALTARAEQEQQVYAADELFELLRRGLSVKCALMREYPYLTLFCLNAYYEDASEICDAIRERVSAAKRQGQDRLRQLTNRERLRDDLPFDDIYRELLYASDGMLNAWYRSGSMDADRFETEYLRMIAHWERVYTRGETP